MPHMPSFRQFAWRDEDAQDDEAHGLKRGSNQRKMNGLVHEENIAETIGFSSKDKNHYEDETWKLREKCKSRKGRRRHGKRHRRRR
jgi:hypothetical protein